MPKPLTQRLRNNFTASSIWKGTEYHRTGRVASFQGEELGVRATVRGTGETYHVTVDWAAVREDGRVWARCSCPRYAEGASCKHIWAVILKADAQGYGEFVPGNGALFLEHEFEDGPDEDEDDLCEEEDDAAWNRVPSTYVPHRWQPSWMDRLRQIRASGLPDDFRRKTGPRPGSREAYFVLNLPAARFPGDLVVDLWARERNAKGEWGALKPCKITSRELGLYADPKDRELLALLLPMTAPEAYSYTGREPWVGKVHVHPSLRESVLKDLAATGRCLLATKWHGAPDDPARPLRLDIEEPWKLDVVLREEGPHYELAGRLTRGGEVLDIRKPLSFPGADLLLFPDSLGRLSEAASLPWLSVLRGNEPIRVPRKEAGKLVEAILSDPTAPAVDWPENLRWEKVTLRPGVKAFFTTPKEGSTNRGILLRIDFLYEGARIPSFDPRAVLADAPSKRFVARDRGFEAEALEKIAAMGGMPPFYRHRDEFSFRVRQRDFIRVAGEMLSWGWEVEAEGKKIRTPGRFDMHVSSGVDWFEVGGEVAFDGTEISFPVLLAAAQRNERLVALGDGTLGILPQEWLERYAPVLAMGETAGDAVRFRRCQALLLDAWLAEEETARKDPAFETFRKKLRSFRRLSPKEPPVGFAGSLRPYQKEGLAWLDFLSGFGLGGILADDMGLGKTVQFLAHLAGRRSRARKIGGPSLVIAPKSVAHNWVEEAARFTPGLKVVRYTGGERKKNLEDLAKADLVVTTYPVVRADIGELKEIEFDVAVADEAQMIKNAGALTAKACKLVRARQKLAMTGTPVENALSDLFSILEFVNPGLLSKKAESAFTKKRAEKGDLALLARALRPVILRRTKERVLAELPDKTEQTLQCELEKSERKSYEELRDYYRATLLKKVESHGIGRSRIQVLTALLRLRQAACHPGLIDRDRVREESAKLDSLVEQLREVTEEGHKALVFSQFTTFLAIVRARLEEEGIEYEYLDGATEDRQARVDRFESQERCRVFLISLKAGGFGLNLVAADYVFLLDPWWNPAVEAQAIDRAHRIGQERKVFAYRLIARGTVEEKILELQKTKRDLADAIISADSGFLAGMTAEDLKLLLS